MEFKKLKCINENVNIDDYFHLYDYVLSQMEHPEWLGVFKREDVIYALENGGKIWLYYDKNKPVCSMFYIPANKKTLTKHKILYDESVTGSLGPIMVSPDYVGNGFQNKMLNELDKYCTKIGKQYIYTKVHSDNTYSVKNMIKNKYELVYEYKNERGNMSSYLKKL